MINNAMQFSQILEEEGESESAADNSRSHSRCVSNVQAHNSKTNLPSNANFDLAQGYSDFVRDCKDICPEKNQLHRFSASVTRPSQSESSSLINKMPLDDKDNCRIRLFE